MTGSGTALRVHGIVTGLLVAVAIASCGGGAGVGSRPLAPTLAIRPEEPGARNPEPGATPAPGAADAPTPAAAPPSSGPPSLAQMKPLLPTEMKDDLRALGLDAKNLPPIEKLKPQVLRGVMKLMARSLGIKCGDCHQEGDFAAPTRRKKIAARMWDEFAAKLTLVGPSGSDGALFCDSCHQGRVELLDRRDKKALSQWMDDNFVARLGAKSNLTGISVECETCHVGMEMHFLAKWGQ